MKNKETKVLETVGVYILNVSQKRFNFELM